jgi:hypothetical protein
MFLANFNGLPPMAMAVAALLEARTFRASNTWKKCSILMNIL